MPDDHKLPNRFNFKRRSPEELEELRRDQERVNRIVDAFKKRFPGGADQLRRERSQLERKREPETPDDLG